MTRRSVCVFAFACIVATSWLRADGSPPAKELLKLDGKELIEAADDVSPSFYTADELIAVAEKLMSHGFVREKGGPLNPFWEYFEQACLKANDQQLDRLVKIYTRLEPRSVERVSVLPTLTSRLVSREVASIRAEKRKVTLARITPALPLELKAAPPELQEAWRTYRRAMLSFENAFPKIDGQIEVSPNEKSFYKLINAALEGSTGLEDKIRQFADTDAKCLGDTNVEDAQDIAILLMLLRERRLDESIGAALRVAGTEGSVSSPEKVMGSVVELIEVCGLDWEMIVAGGQAANELRGGRFWGSNPYLAALTEYGSARVGLLVNQLAHLSKPDARAPYVGAFRTWIETAPKLQKCNGKDVDVGRTDYELRAGRAMPRTVQEAFLHTAEEFSTADCSEDMARYALNIFGRTQAASSIPALQALTRHVSDEVGRDAATVLCAMGLTTTRPPVGAPVRFRILLNGKPVSVGQEVGWTVSSTTDTVNDRTEANAEGVVELPRRHFLSTSKPAREVELYTLGHQANGPTFKVRTPVPGNLDATADVPVKISSLEITLTNQDHLNAPAPKKAFLYFVPHDEESAPSDGLSDASDGTSKIQMRRIGINVFQSQYEVPAQPSISVPAVQDGIYDVFIGVAGAEVWQGIARVGPGAPKTDAALKAGSDVRFEVVTPDSSPGSRADIFKDGKEFDAEGSYPRGYRALPCGHYEICICGSEWIDQYRQTMNLKRGPDEVRYAGREIFFEITEGSPAIIDLGEIKLEAAAN